jgi:hypothetical protein
MTYPYIDNDIVTKRAHAGPDLPTGKRIRIGSYRGQGDNYRGLINDVAIFEGVSTPADIDVIYNLGVRMLVHPPLEGTRITLR